MTQNTIKPSEISDILLGQLKDIDTTVHFEETGKVLQVSDGVARIYGLVNAEAGELLEFDSGVKGVVMNRSAGWAASLPSMWEKGWSAAW